MVDKDGNPFVVAVYNLDPSLFPEQYRDLAGPIPLMIAEKGEKGWEWTEATLKKLAEKRRIYVGTTATYFSAVDPKVLQIVEKHFNLLVTENDLKWNNIEKERGKINTKRANHFKEETAKIAQENGMQIIGHSLVFWENYPEW